MASASTPVRVFHVIIATSFECQQRTVFDVPSINFLKRGPMVPSDWLDGVRLVVSAVRADGDVGDVETETFTGA